VSLPGAQRSGNPRHASERCGRSFLVDDFPIIVARNNQSLYYIITYEPCNHGLKGLTRTILAMNGYAFMNLTDNEKRDVIKYLEADKPLPERYRFLL
jgi:hypothetical protein